VCNLGGPTERVHLVGVSISIEKNFYRLPFTPPLSGRLIGPSVVRTGALERGGPCRGGVEPSSEADLPRGSVEPSSEADLV
jgi:hypothetical protein